MISSAISSISSIPLAQSAPAPSAATAAPSADQGFDSILKSLATNTIDTLKAGETTAISAVEGKASVQQAVMATMQAEQSLQAALAIRDKVVSAFLEISRMQI